MSHGFATKLEGEGVTVAEWVVLRELYDVEALAPSVIADRLGMTRGLSPSWPTGWRRRR